MVMDISGQVLLERTVSDKSARIYYGSGASQASIADEECSVIYFCFFAFFVVLFCLIVLPFCFELDISFSKHSRRGVLGNIKLIKPLPPCKLSTLMRVKLVHCFDHLLRFPHSATKCKTKYYSVKLFGTKKYSISWRSWSTATSAR